MSEVSADWQVYMILCSDTSLYTGITNDLERRMARHAAGQGAKFFNGRAPGPVVYLETGHTRGSASRREAAIKKLRRDEKLQLIAAATNCLAAGASRN